MLKIPDLQYKTLPVLHPPRTVLPSDESLPCIYIFQKYQPYSLQGLPLPQKDPLKVPYVVDCTVYSPTGVPRKVSALTFVVFSGKRSQRTAACKSSGAKPFHTFRQNDLCKTAAFKKRTISDYFQCFRKYNFLKIFKIRKTLLSNGSNSLFYYNFSYRIPYCNPWNFFCSGIIRHFTFSGHRQNPIFKLP